MTVLLQERWCVQEDWRREPVLTNSSLPDASCPGRAATPFALLRRAGSQKAVRYNAEKWARLGSVPPKWRCAASGARERCLALNCVNIVIASGAKQSRIPPQ